MPAPSYPLGHKLESAPALTAPQTLNLAAQLGIRLVLNDGNLRAIGGHDAITELAPHIRVCKPELVRLLAIEAANDRTVQAPGQHHADTVQAESLGAPTTPQRLAQHGVSFCSKLKGPVPEPGQRPAHTAPAPEHPAAVAWHALDMAYQAHHFKCPICIAAGRGVRYGLRCGVGAALWADYERAGQQPGAFPWIKPKKGQRHD